MTTIPKTSRAVVQPDPSSSHLEATTLPVPSHGADNYLIQVKGTSPCPGELTWEKAFPSLFSARTHRVPGTEGAGVIVASPPEAPLKAGDEVWWRVQAWLHGSLREYTAIPTECVSLKAKTLNWTEASATPLSALTGWQGVFDQGVLDPAGINDAAVREVNASKRVMVTGASGSVGNWAVRFGAAAGGYMVAVGSGAKADEMRDAGAKEVVDYKGDGVAAWAKENKVDQVLDCTGRDTEKAWGALEDGGAFLSVCIDPNSTKPEGKSASVAKWFLVEPRGADLANISKLVDDRGWRPMIDSVVPFDEFQAAFDKVDGGRASGKVVITVSE